MKKKLDYGRKRESLGEQTHTKVLRIVEDFLDFYWVHVKLNFHQRKSCETRESLSVHRGWWDAEGGHWGCQARSWRHRAGNHTWNSLERGLCNFFLSRWRKNSFWLLFYFFASWMRHSEGRCWLVDKNDCFVWQGRKNIFTFSKTFTSDFVLLPKKTGIKTNSNNFFLLFCYNLLTFDGW